MKAVVSIILAIYVLAGSIGTPFSRHTCYTSETTEYGVSISDDCCGKNSDSGQKYSIEDPCCDFASTYFQLDLEALSFIGIFAFAVPVEIQEFTYELPQIVKESQFSSLVNKAPPLPYGRHLLSLVQSFII